MTRPTLKELIDLTGKAALVTGGARGIGAAIASRLAEAGAAVMVGDLNLAQARETAQRLVAEGGQADALQADVSLRADAEGSIARTVERFGRLDILVNNAGIFRFCPVDEIDENLWRSMQAVNVDGVFYHCQAAVRQMRAAGTGGSIINLASMSGIRPTFMETHYNAAKAAVVMITQSIAYEVGPEIRVNAIAPGGVNTPGVAAMANPYDGPQGKRMMEMHAMLGKRVPLGRMAEPDEIARAALFLASPLSSYVTGHVLAVDGGFLVT
ncbi:MAG: SDR family NAD(P)-dependent oxidoreductase [Gammaproteobacteria bacterium]